MHRAAVVLAIVLLSAGGMSAQQRRPRPAPQTPAQPAPVAPTAPAGPTVDAALLAALKARSIGPALMGGRVSDIALDPNDPYTFYQAFATSGLWRSQDNGITFQLLLEKEGVWSVGAVAVSPSDSKVVWVGTGEANDRNSSGWGNGVYRTADGGQTWTHAGLAQSKTIARIVTHPTDANTAWVAAMGDLWSFGGERGLYKTTDGGKSWKLVLAAPAPFGDRTGCGDVAIDPSDPNTLYAVLYARRRTPWSFSYGTEVTDGKDIGGIFKSSDGGETWRKLTSGLPGAMGRIGLDVHLKNPRIVYAIVQSDEGGTSGIDDIQSKRGGVFRSEDGGETWTRRNALNPRPFYFSQIRVDPENDQRIYVLGFALHVSEDGGRTFREDLGEKMHPDFHALAIDARNPKRVYTGTDGGSYRSYDGGKSWEHLNRIAAGQFYRVGFDMSTPYRVCGGLQDNLNWVGPSRTRSKEGILNYDWVNLGGGDGFYCVFDPENPSIVYTESQEGYVHRLDMSTDQVKQLRPEPTEGQRAFRFHWNSPLVGSRHAKGTLYLGGNRVFRLKSKGEHWDVISPDLSAQDPQKVGVVGSGAENYAVVYALAESPLKAGMLWAGTDDGKIWLTEDDGANWNDLTASLPAEAKGQWIYRIEPSAHDASVAYLAVSAFRSGNYAPLAYRTADKGKTWQSIAANLPANEPAKVVREDPTNPDLLYAGTEHGLFVSLNRGGNWVKFGGLPVVPVDDIAIHPRDRDLIIATHGRSIYIVDDVRPLQEMKQEVLDKEAHLFEPRAALAIHPAQGFADWNGKAVFRGKNPPEGALVSFYVGKFSGQQAEIVISNAGGTPVAKFEMVPTPGINRLAWDMKPTKNLLTEYGSEGQKFVPAGEYTISLSYGKTTASQKIKVDVAPGVETR